MRKRKKNGDREREREREIDSDKWDRKRDRKFNCTMLYEQIYRCIEDNRE